MNIRKEKTRDFAAVHELNELAFDSGAEARLVENLREIVSPIISLVAEQDGLIVGHILFTPVTLGEYEHLKLMGLGPMAVDPEYQRRGVGSALIRKGLEQCRVMHQDAVFVLGHPEYYPRFGFIPSVQYLIRSEFAVPDDVFMVLELETGSLKGREGIVRYHPEFLKVSSEE